MGRHMWEKPQNFTGMRALAQLREPPSLSDPASSPMALVAESSSDYGQGDLLHHLPHGSQTASPSSHSQLSFLRSLV